MPFGCFGKRKKQDRADKPNDKSAVDGNTAKTNSGEDGVTKPVEDSNAEVNEVIAVARAHSLHASAPNSVEHRHTTIGIQKSATLARYDFLRKSDYTNTADRWAALKQQYLEQHAGQNGSAGGGASTGDNKVKRAAMSLPRQFAPPNSANSVVRFSHWFYERQTMEADARKEFQEREEKTRKLLDGVEHEVSIPEETAASKTDDVADNGSEQAPEAEETPASKDTEEEETEAAEPEDAADEVKSSSTVEVPEQQEEDSKAEPNAIEEDQDNAVQESDEQTSQYEEGADEVNETETSPEFKAENNGEAPPTSDGQVDATSSSGVVEPAAKLTDDGPAAVVADASESHD